ncbi:MAG: response regulator [Elusimicrobia bacterium]|nr:response regulator [Elusimicrobiota bacterium]
MGKRILLVEDNSDDEKLIVTTLKENAAANAIVVAADGQEALDYLFAAGPHSGRDVRDLPTVVLLDLHLPRVDGLAVLTRIRAEKSTKRLPVVILTSSDEADDRLASYDCGANSYVRKPVNFDDFAKTIRELQLYWLLLNVPPTS